MYKTFYRKQAVNFEMNGKTYETDSETRSVLQGIVPTAKLSHDYSAVTAVMALGLETGRIVEVK
jgi:hypothetical protein